MTASHHPARTPTTAEQTESAMTTGTITHTIEDDNPPTWRDHVADAIGARLHAVDTPTGRSITNVIKRARPRRQRQPGSGLISAGMVLLGLLDLGLLYVVFAAQARFVFNVKHEHAASIVQALGLDTAMIIFSVLALGLARKGLAASSERVCIVLCACASAFMAWAAADQASLRSVAVYVSAPLLLALTTDRTISVVRRHVLGMKDDGSVWARLGHHVGHVVLYSLRLLVDFTGTRRGIRRAILAAAPLPGQSPEALATETAVEKLAASVATLDGAVRTLAQGNAGVSDLAQSTAKRLVALGEELGGRLDDLGDSMADLGRYTREDLAALRGRLERRELDAAAGGNGAAVYPSKKAHFLALYRQHGEHGRREVASRVAGELAEAAGLQPGTARAYIYEELARLAGDPGQASTHREAGLIMDPAASKEDHR